MIDIFCKYVIKVLNINKAIETGTFLGESFAQLAIWFSEMYPGEFGVIDYLIPGRIGPNPWNTFIIYPVITNSKPSNKKIYTVELDQARYEYVKQIFDCSNSPNIINAPGDSVKYLKEMIDKGEVSGADNVFFYLDAHWQTTPLREEITQILRLNKFVISIDDFFDPKHPEWGYDAPSGNMYCWDWIKDLFAGRKILLCYPVRSNTDNRGWCLIFCGYADPDLQFLKNLPVRGEWHG